jgi:thiamine kinase-like enzyme
MLEVCVALNAAIGFEWTADIATIPAAAAFTSVKQVSGGITNQLFRCTVGARSVLIRIYGRNTEVLIARELDEKVSCLLGERGFGPRIYGRFGNGRVEEWLPGRALEPDEMKAPALLPAIAAQVRSANVM